MIALLLASLGLAATVEVEEEPTAVTVYADRARVTRSTSVSLGAGPQEVAFTGLPARVLGGAVTADARGPGKLVGVDLVRVTASQVADARVAEIQEELQGHRDQRQDIVDEQTAASAKLAAATRARAEAAKALNLQLLVGTAAPRRARALRTRLAAQEEAARDELRAARLEQRDLDQLIAALERERATLGSSATDTWRAVVHVDMDRPGRVSVDLHYLVGGCSWAPRYDIRGDASTGAVELGLSAVVSQRSGEDWEGVDLSVSSARPGLGTTVPQLDPYWLSRPVVRRTKAKRSSGARAAAPMAMAEMDDMAGAPPPEPEPFVEMEVATAEVQVQLAATTFTVARPEGVPADGTERKVLLTTEQLQADLRHVVVPRLDPRAWLVGEVVNTASFPLLAGEAGVFLSGSYLGDFQMRTVAPGEDFDLSFGVDDRVAVRRVPRELTRGDPKLVGKKARARWEWDDEVHNGHRRPITVELHEQVPVSSRDDVKVELLDLTAGTPAPEEGKGGLLEFTFEVQPGGKKTLGWGYQIEYPADLSLGWME